jgi:hypothetical protein
MIARGIIAAIVIVGLVGSFLLGIATLNISLPTEPMCFPAEKESFPNIEDKDSYTFDDTIDVGDSLAEDGYIFSEGESMEPSIPDGALCKCIVTDDYDVGDIVIFRLPDKDEAYLLVDHRIIAANSSHVITQGDNNPEPDGVIAYDDIFCEIPQVSPLEMMIEKIKLEGFPWTMQQ